MLPEQWSHVVSASVAPVVFISASALLCLALYNRLAAIINRLRAVQRERLAMQDQLNRLSPADLEREPARNSLSLLESLADQTLRIRRRARLIRNSLLLLMAAIGSLIISSFLAGGMIFWPQLTALAAAAFALGLILAFAGVLYAAIELTHALRPVELEADIVSRIASGRRRLADRTTPPRGEPAKSQPKPPAQPTGPAEPR